MFYPAWIIDQTVRQRDDAGGILDGLHHLLNLLGIHVRGFNKQRISLLFRVLLPCLRHLVAFVSGHGRNVGCGVLQNGTTPVANDWCFSICG